MENKNEVFPQDIQNEILLRMPLKSLGKCICVSKKWASIIREKYFRDRYFLQSMTRPRLLFVFARRDDETNVLFHSVYQEKEPLLSSCQQQTRITLDQESSVCAVTGGLVCIKSRFKIVLCNPGTKKFLSLPELKELYQDREVVFIKTYLGYDKDSDVFKVLCVTTKRVDDRRDDYRVFTVGSNEECWRTIAYKPEHIPFTEGLCKDGVLYYGCLSISNGDPIMMSFNLRSEEFTVTELPKQFRNILGTSLVNYNGEIALVNRFVDENGEIKIWVRNEIAGDLREEHIVIPRWRETIGDDCEGFSFKGTIGTGELVFASKKNTMKGSMIVLYYDKITQHLRKFEIDGVGSDSFQLHYVSSYLDHFDSLLLI